MKLLNVSLTITDEDNNEQLVGLRAPHLTGLQASELIGMVTAGILVEPAPEVVTLPLPKKRRHNFLRKTRPNNIDLTQVDQQ